MVIGIDASRANRTHRSGTEWYSFYLLRELARIDSENQYILYTDEPLKPDLLNFCDEEVLVSKVDSQGFQKIKSPFNNFQGKVLGWPLHCLWTQGRLSIEMLLHAPDVLFVPSHTLPLIHPKKSVTTIHDVAFERDRSIYQTAQLGPQTRWGRRFLNSLALVVTGGKYSANTLDYLAWSTIYGLKNAFKVITVSESSHQEMVEIYGKDLPKEVFDKIKVVHNGFDSTVFKEELDPIKTAQVLKKYGITTPYIFYLGRIERKKNIPNLIEAFGMLQQQKTDLNLVLTGASSYGADEVGYMVSEYGLDNKVIKTGWVDEADLPYIFHMATAFVFPSLYEGFGIPLLEAMACGVPVIASTAPAVKEVLGDAAIFFDPKDKQAIANAILTISTENELRQALISKGRARVKSFSWHKCAQETLAILNTL